MENIRIKKIGKKTIVFPNNFLIRLDFFEQRGKLALNLNIKAMKSNHRT